MLEIKKMKKLVGKKIEKKFKLKIVRVTTKVIHCWLTLQDRDFLRVL